ncbi:MAG: peptide/nickel transport system substrate-binding protein, partial [Chloroflexota bacterium]|nr:peptide/nickel transport system substrate-binding protein [Chloroflexota bacterium]
DPRGAAVGKPFSSFPYDPTRAAAELEEAGWRRGADGRMLNTAGQAVQIPIRSTAAFVTEMAIAAARWRELGLEVQEETSPPGENAEGRAKYPGFVSIARGTGDGVLTNFDSRNIPKASNRYTGQNVGGYANPAMDRLIDTLSTTIDQQEQARILASVANIFATDLPALPIYFRIEMVAQLRSVRALETSYAAADSGTIAHNAYLWDRD